LRILHVTPFYEPAWAYGGMVRASAALCRTLARRGHEVTVATALLAAGLPPDETLGGVRVRRFPARLKRFLVPWAPGLAPYCSRELASFDAVHLHGHRNGLAVTAARALRRAGRRFVLTTSGTFPHHGQHRLAKRLFDRSVGDAIVSEAAVLVAVSESEARDLPRPARVVPNGVLPAGVPHAARARSGTRLLFVGNDRLQKRGHLLPQLLDALPGVDLDLVGPLGAAFLRRFARFGPRVAARGVLSGDALAAAYAGADLVVHPAVGEAFGLVPFEAALAGTAAVVAGGHGCGEWYGRAGGCVVPADDVPRLAGAVRERLDRPGRAEAEARAAAAFAREHLTWERAAEAMEAAYAEAAAAR
jgi:glycosyltransferase involved in cell wall biosynthesis